VAKAVRVRVSPSAPNIDSQLGGSPSWLFIERCFSLRHEVLSR
jgi:hypothetical protein